MISENLLTLIKNAYKNVVFSQLLLSTYTLSLAYFSFSSLGIFQDIVD